MDKLSPGHLIVIKGDVDLDSWKITSRSSTVSVGDMDFLKSGRLMELSKWTRNFMIFYVK